MSRYRTTQESFLKDVARHQIAILRDDGVYRHIRFKQPDTSDQYFDLITWPGHLCYTGDMGTYVFTRTNDMFDFFRSSNSLEQLNINPPYWSEKLIAIDGSSSGGAATEFDHEKFKRIINLYRVTWMRYGKREGRLSKEERRELWEAVDDQVLNRMDDYGETILRDAHEFQHGDYSFYELFEHSFTRIKNRMIWCCFALTWGILKYDEYKLQEECKQYQMNEAGAAA